MCYKSISFWVKMALLGLVGLNALVSRRGAYAKLSACTSLLLWIALVFSGRGIAFL